MKTSPVTRRLRAGFTLIELLVVISIIALLAGLAIPAATGVAKKAKKVKTLATLKDLTVGVKNYQVEYNRYPIKAGDTSESPVETTEGSTLLKVLLGKNEEKLNPREISYIEPPMAKDGVGGLTGAEDSYGLMDMWGEPYYVIMDANYDNKIMNPDTQNDDPEISEGAPQNLPIGVIAYSKGEDKEPNTKDDIASWRP